MVENLSQDRRTQQEIRDKMHDYSCQLLARESMVNAKVVEVDATGMAFGQRPSYGDIVTKNKMAFGPASGFDRLPLFCRQELSSVKTTRLGELSDGLHALLLSLFRNRKKPAVYGGVKFLKHGTDDFASRDAMKLDPLWKQFKGYQGTLDFERLRTSVKADFPDGPMQTRVCGLDAEVKLDIKRLPLVGDPQHVHLFSGDLSAKVVYPYGGYWRETTTIIAVPEALDDPEFQCRWAFEEYKEASTVDVAMPLPDAFLPVVSFYALTHPGMDGRYMVQEVSVILNRQRTAVMGLQICYTSLHGWLLREGNLAGLGAFLF